MKTEYKHFEKGYWVSNTGKIKRDRRGKVEKVKIIKGKCGYLFFVMYGYNDEQKICTSCCC